MMCLIGGFIEIEIRKKAGRATIPSIHFSINILFYFIIVLIYIYCLKHNVGILKEIFSLLYILFGISIDFRTKFS